MVLTLLALVLLTVLVVGFNAATRTEQMAARNFSYQGVASQMAEVGVNRAVALLNSTVTNGVVTQPGRAWSPDSGFVQLSTAAVGAGGTNINLNRQQADTSETNYFIATNTNAAFFAVPLIDARVGTNLVGRYGFWIDDDGSKVSLNAAWNWSNTSRPSFLPTNARPYSIAVFTNLPALSPANLANFGPLITDAQTNTTLGWSYFFTTRQLMMLSNLDIRTYQKLMFQTAGGPGNQARATFALAPNGQPGALEAGGANGMLSVYGNANYTRRYAQLLQALDGVTGRYLSGAQFAKYFGDVGGLSAKYGPDLTRQIVANINDAVLPTTADAFTGAGATDMLTGTNTTGTNNPVPRAVLGLRPTPYLNEVALGVAWSTNTSRRVELQVWMTCEIVDPYRTGLGTGWQVKYKIKDLNFSGTFQQGGTNRTFTGGTNNWNSDGSASNNPSRAVTNAVNLADPVAPEGYQVPTQAFVFEWQLGTPNGITPGPLPTNASNFVFNNVTVRPALALLRVSTNPLSVRDWAVELDFPSFTFSSVPQVAVGFDYEGTRAAPAPPEVVFSQGISKNDPRVRRFQTYQPPAGALPWVQAPPSLGAANPTFAPSSGTGVPGLSNDLAGGATTIYNHPSFPTNTNGAPADRIIPQWVSALDLGKVHTGLPWRTLQLRAQDAPERAAGFVPDWVLLESFTVSNNPVAVPAKMNVNSLAYPAAATTGMTAAALLGAGMARPLAVASLFAGNTTNATNAEINGVNLGIPASAGFATNAGTNSFLGVASNVSRLGFTPTWGGNRPTNLPTNALGMLAEVLEISGVSDFGNDEGAREGRVRGFYDALAAASDVFTIYSVGYAMDRNTNVTGETFLRTQVARDPADPTKFRVIFTEPLIWK